jgi:predicted exporter
MPSLRPNFDRRAGRLGRISLGVVIGWIGGLVAVALTYNTLHASNLAFGVCVTAGHYADGAIRRLIRSRAGGGGSL